MTAPPRPVSPIIGLAAVNVGTPRVIAELRDERVWSGIGKQPVEPGTVLWLSAVNLSGDGQADLAVHGGFDKAVYVYPSEHLPEWSRDLEADGVAGLGPAPFGENLSTTGVLERDVRIGDVWRWGDAILQVAQPRWPCFKLGLHRRRPDILDRLRETGRTGWYLRVLEQGEVIVGDEIDVIERDARELTVHDAHVARADTALRNPDLVRRVAEHPALADRWRAPLIARLGRPGQ